MKKLFIVSLIMLMALTACAKDSDVEPITEETEQTIEPIEEETTELLEEQAEEQQNEESEEPIENDTTEQPEEPIENESTEETEEPEEQTETETTEEVRIDTGKFSGMIDANFFEVQISGVPESISARVFMLTDESREIFNELKLESDDEIKIHYYVNEHEQMVVVDIEKLN